MRFNRAALCLTASTFGLAMAFAPLAQAADAPASQKPAASTLETLVVTAERRTTNLQTTPIAVSALSGEQLQAKGIDTVDALQFATPSLTVNNFGQGNDFNIRGIGKGETNVQTPSGVITYRDGVASFPGFFQDEPYFDVASIEVLRGPQGTFAGQNATGGAVFINTRDPSLNGVSGDIEGQYGNYNDARLRGAVNVPLSSTFAARLAVNAEQRDSFYKFTGPVPGHPGRLRETSVRLGLLWKPTDNFSAVLKLDADNIDQGGYPADPANATNDIFHITNNGPNAAKDRFTRAILNMTYTFQDGIALHSISGYQHGHTSEAVDLDGTNLAHLSFTDFATEEIYSQEVNLVSPEQGPLRWVAGLYYQHDVVDIPLGGFDIGLPPGAFDIDLIYHTPKETKAAFGQVSYDLTEAFQIQGGLRYTKSTFGLTDNNYINGRPDLGRLGHQSTEDSKLTGKLALNWKLNSDNFLYAFVATGHKAAGINTTPPPGGTMPDPFRPEDVTDYEVGWKPTFADGHVRLQLGAYYNRYRNFQVSLFNAAESQTTIQNADGTTIIYGVEAQGQAAIGQLGLDFGAGYLHSELGGAFSGKKQPNAPPWTFNVGAQYEFQLANGATLTPRADYGYVAKQWFNIANTGQLVARNLVNAQLSYKTGAWRVTGYATNLFDLHYAVASNVNLRYAGAPRQFGVRLGREF